MKDLTIIIVAHQLSHDVMKAGVCEQEQEEETSKKCTSYSGDDFIVIGVNVAILKPQYINFVQ